MQRRFGSKLGVKPRKETKRDFYTLSQVVFYLILRWPQLLFLVLIIILYPRQYLLMKMKWMYLTLYSVNTWFGFIFSFLEREEPEWCLECQGRVCHKDIIALENGHLLPFKSHVYECENVCARERARETENKCRYLGLWFHFWSFWKVFLFFITGVFTVQIHEKNPMDTILFFKSKMFVMCKERDRGGDNTMD